ncbi:F-box/kelch-repeat protein At3g23880-like [Lycium ferocissimum]|uniref:F-box/kelch-repeat protein At3g23880-like n=1 Tax=Lycium ferocissimum TaxID=112874 RepID=UPI002814D48C|nr:F-box/kelch-repeat protein At3g23880-like [Lycium ferocissimum]XP_059300108.1 F-box/kelch-repeat protein At3g23880-like [Lycium ferocissimum]
MEDPKRGKPTMDSQFPSTSMHLTNLDLPPELITEILSRLRVKPLLKFRCVSKSWLALISSPEFIKTHLSICANNKDYTNHALMLGPRQPNNNLMYCSLRSLLYNDSVTHAFDLDYPMKLPHKSLSIVGSVNGLICFTIEEQHNFLWNPSIRMFKKLPYSRSTLRSKYFLMYGFGYDELHDDYKVVGITTSDNKGSCHVKIYSLNSHCWRSTDDFHGELPVGKSGMVVNGKLHWFTFIAGLSAIDRVGLNGRDIVSVNLADGKYGKVEHPCYGEGKFDLTLGVLGSDLSVVCNNGKTYTDVWVMKEYGVKESWIKMLTINPPNNPLNHLFCPLFCMSNKSQILFEDGSTFMIYNLKDDSIRYRNITNCADFRDANIYIESLVLPFRQKKPRMQQKRGLKKCR